MRSEERNFPNYSNNNKSIELGQSMLTGVGKGKRILQID